MRRKFSAFLLVFVLASLFIAPGLAAKNGNGDNGNKKSVYDICAIVNSPTEMISNPSLYQQTASCLFTHSITIKAVFLLMMIIYLFFEPLFMDLIVESPIILGFDILGLLISLLSAIFLWTIAPLRYALVYLSGAGDSIYLAIVILLFFANILRTRYKRAELTKSEPLIGQ